MGLTIIRPDGSAWTFDATIREDFSPALVATDHPIADGSAVTDHVQRLPLALTVECLMTESPYVDATANQIRAAQIPVGTARVLAALDFLRACEGELLDVVSTRLGTFRSMALLRYPHSVDRARRLGFLLDFRQIEVGNAQSVTIPPARPRTEVQVGAPSEQDVGDQAATQRRPADRANQVAENPRDADDRSLAARAYDWIRG